MTYFLLYWYDNFEGIDFVGVDRETARPFSTLEEAKAYEREFYNERPKGWTPPHTKIISLPDDDPVHVTRAQASRLLGKSPRQLQRWEKAGKLHPIFIPGRGNVMYYSRQEVDALSR